MMKVLVVYESTRGRTQAMAKGICEGVRAAYAEIQEHPLRAKDCPSEEILESCRNLGKQLVSSCAK